MIELSDTQERFIAIHFKPVKEWKQHFKDTLVRASTKHLSVTITAVEFVELLNAGYMHVEGNTVHLTSEGKKAWLKSARKDFKADRVYPTGPLKYIAQVEGDFVVAQQDDAALPIVLPEAEWLALEVVRESAKT